MQISCPQCKLVFEVEASGPLSNVPCPGCGQQVNLVDVLTVSIMGAPTGSTVDDQDSMIADSFGAPGLGQEVGRFRLLRELGRGGFGTVYEAFDDRLERSVAVKVPNVDVLSSEQASVFLREARLAAQLQDPNIVSVFEVGRDGRRIFIVSELIRGETLTQWVRHKQVSDREVAAMMETIARAIHRAHEASIVHRDLKLSNVLVDQKNQPHITDFGLAKRIDAEEMTIAESGKLLGTLAYMSPEQASGNANTAGPRSDVYSLGVMLYVLLSGKYPFGKPSSDLVSDIVEGNAIPLREAMPEVHRDLEAICRRAMENKTEQRYASALDFADDLQRFLQRRPVAARNPGRITQTHYLVRRNWLVTTAFALGGLMVIGGRFLWPGPGPEKRSVSEVDSPATNPDSKAENKTFPIQLSVAPDCRSLAARQVLIAEYGQLGDRVVASRTTPDEFVLELAAGLYLFEARHERGNFLFYRWVRQDEFTSEIMPQGPRISRFELDRNTQRFVLPDYTILIPESISDLRWKAGPEELVEISGGAIDPQVKDRWGYKQDDESVNWLGQVGQRPRFPKTLSPVKPFLLGAAEVTAENFKQVMGDYPRAMRPAPDGGYASDQVATGVTWAEAIEYAELCGARLPTLDEYVFVATQGGQQAFPWGDQNRTEPWAIGTIRTPAYDEVDGVFNLYSSVGEWVWDVNLMGPSAKMNGNPYHWTQERMVVGIPRKAITAQFLGPIERIHDGSNAESPCQITFVGALQQSPRIGFRIARDLPEK